MTALKDVRGMTDEMATKLKGLGIDNSDELLAGAKTAAARSELARKLGVEDKVLLELANRADLIRIKGVAGAFSDLLENAGVDTVKELSRRTPENLQKRLAEINEQTKLSHRTPTLEMVQEWVAEAKSLPAGIEY